MIRQTNKQLSFCILLLLPLLLLLPQHLFGAEDPDGFRGIKWGTPFNSLKGLVFSRIDSSFGGIKAFKKPDDSLEIGAAKLEAIEYLFWRDKLSGVMIETKGEINYSNLKEAVFKRFGPGEKENEFSERYFWINNKISSIILSFNVISGTGLLSISSRDINNQMQRYKELKAQEGSEKGF